MNIISYLEWRGDISIARLPLCEADYAVIGCCSYFPFDGIVPEDFESAPVSMWNAINRLRELESLEGDGRCFHYSEDDEMTARLMTSPRFTSLGLIGFRNKIDVEKEEQFSAMTILLPNNQTMIVFRGTDKTLTGWKEDFNMMYLDSIPSQQDALKYLEESASHSHGDIYVCGHSKGGNLAMYSAAYCSDEVKGRIKEIVNLDGPGFSKERIESKEFLSIRDRLRTFVPQQSIVGMLLEHREKHSVVHSSKIAFWQHSLYSWEVRRGDFIRETDVKTLSRNVDATLKNWLLSMDKEKREKMIEGFWSVVESAGVNDIQDLFTLKSTANMMKKVGKIDDETREIMRETTRLFLKAIKKMQTDNREQRKEIRKENRRKKNLIDIQDSKV
ncbi:MAG: DUF2974 domain-containing protein [Lachnospiraceae bacterium]|nr:DUF2974 domain-containing protein [Lachnospiraceae bacterium]